ncbi:MAG TPA: isochorismate synthase [Ktedonobacteraceae bacterium]
MEKVIVNSTRSCNPASLAGNLAQLHPLLSKAAMQAAHTNRAVLASLILPISESNPLQIFRAMHRLHPGACFYWEQPARQTAFVGTGTALSIQTSGSRHFADAALAWQALRDEALVFHVADEAEGASHALDGPALFSGFSFDPLRPATSLWQDFPDGLLILPSLLFRQHKEQTILALNYLVQPTDNLDNLMNTLTQEITRFSELLATLPDSSLNLPEETQAYKLRDVLPVNDWKKLIDHTVHLIQEGSYAKVVLARAVEVTMDEYQPSFSLTRTLQRLRQSYPAAYIFAFQRGERTFVGATPERLVYAQDGQLHTMALAGSASRGASQSEDRLLGSALLASPKNRAEHEFVTTMLRASLDHLCSKIWIADTPELLRLKNIQHLQTALIGELLPNRNILEALHILHPTPAVGGTPTEAALRFIREHEHLDRGWYAGPIGWIDLHGNGEFAVALRSAILERRRATLFAGCGIVKDSNPEAEYLESRLKLQVMWRSLSGEE